MKAVIDTNVVIDALKPNSDFITDAKRVFQLIYQEKITAFLTVNSLTDIFYILKKTQGDEKAKTAIANLISAFEIISLEKADCVDALALRDIDFEDAIIAVCAKKINADIIVTRDIEFLKSKYETDVISPNQLVKRFNLL